MIAVGCGASGIRYLDDSLVMWWIWSWETCECGSVGVVVSGSCWRDGRDGHVNNCIIAEKLIEGKHGKETGGPCWYSKLGGTASIINLTS
jgi:hypothetical protein